MKKTAFTVYRALLGYSGQSMTEYLIVVFLISFAVLQSVQTFGTALNAAFLQAINNIAISIK